MITTEVEITSGILVSLEIDSSNFLILILSLTADVTLLVMLKINHIKIDKVIHANLTKMDIKLLARNGRLKLEGLFNGKQPLLQDLLNQGINENFEVYMKTLYPALEKSLSIVLKDVINKLFMRFTKDQLFPA